MTSISGQVGRLKQAAIDAAMRRGGYRADGDSYLSIQLPDYGVVTRPGEDGLGGGIAVRIPAEHPRARLNSSQIAEMKRSATENFTAEFERIRTTIDTIVAPWEELPQGSTIDSVAEKCDTLVSNLMGAITESGSAFSGSGELGSVLSRVVMESTSFGGGALDDFKMRYIDDGVTRAARLTALAEVLGQAICAEAEVWRAAQDDRDSLLAQYITEFDKVAQGDGGSLELGFKIVGAALAGAALFTTAGTGTAIAIAGAGIIADLGAEIAKEESETSKNERRAFDDVDSGLNAFKQSFEALSSRIYEEESALIAAVDATIDRVKDSADKFQLAPAPIYKWEDDVMYAEPEKNLSLARTFLPQAAELTETASSEPSDIASDLTEALQHDYAAGNRSAGASYTVAAFARMTKTLLAEFAWDLDRGATNLEYALLDLMGTEESNTEQTQELAAEIESGETHNGREADELLDPPKPPTFDYRLHELMQ